jgi:hypothetical protein
MLRELFSISQQALALHKGMFFHKKNPENRLEVFEAAVMERGGFI